MVIGFVPAKEHKIGSFPHLDRGRRARRAWRKTQLLAFILAGRFKKPLPIIAGILCATLVNHGLAGALGAWITSVVSPEVMRWILGLSFIGIAIWTMIPDKIENEETQVARHLGVFGATLITFAAPSEVKQLHQGVLFISNSRIQYLASASLSNAAALPKRVIPTPMLNGNLRFRHLQAAAKFRGNDRRAVLP